MRGVEADVVEARHLAGDHGLGADGLVPVEVDIIHHHLPITRHRRECCAEIVKSSMAKKVGCSDEFGERFGVEV